MEKEVALPLAPTEKEQHEKILQELCRICGNRCITNESEQMTKKILPRAQMYPLIKKILPRAEMYPLIKKKHSIDINTDQPSRHPPYLCYACFWKLVYEKSKSSEERPVYIMPSWPEHTSNCVICLRYKIQCKMQESPDTQCHTPVKRQKTRHDQNQQSDQSPESVTEKTPTSKTVSGPHPVKAPTVSVSRSDAAKTSKENLPNTSSSDPFRRTAVSLNNMGPTHVVVSRSKQTQGDPKKPENDYFIIPTSLKQNSTNNAGVKIIAKNSKGNFSFVSPSVSVSQETSSVVTTSQQSNSNQSSPSSSDEDLEPPTPSSINKIMQAATIILNSTTQLTTPTSDKTPQLTTPTSDKTPQLTTPTSNETAQSTALTPNKLTTPTPNKTAQLTTPTSKHITPLPTPPTYKVVRFMKPTPGKTTQIINPTPLNVARLTTPTPSKTTPHGTAKLTTPTSSKTVLLTTSHGTAQLTKSPHKTAKWTTPTSSKTKQLTTPTTNKTAQLTVPPCKPQKSYLRNPGSTSLSKNKSVLYTIPNTNKTFQLTNMTNQASNKMTIQVIVPPPASNQTTKSSSTPAPTKTIQLNPFATNKTPERTEQPSTPARKLTNKEPLPDEFFDRILQRPLTAPLTKKMEKIATHLFLMKLTQSGGVKADFLTADDQDLTALLVPGKHTVNTRNAIGSTVASQKKFLKQVKRIVGEFDERSSPSLCPSCHQKDRLINKYRIALYEEKKRRQREHHLQRLLAVHDAQPAKASKGSSIRSGATNATTNNTSSRRKGRTRKYVS